MLAILVAIMLVTLVASVAADTVLKVERLRPSSPGYVGVIVDGLPGGLVRFSCTIRNAEGDVLGEDTEYTSSSKGRALVRVEEGSEATAATAECRLAK